MLALLCNCFIPITQLTIPSFLFFFIKMFLGGILLWATQIPFLYLTIRTRGFIAPIIAIATTSFINVILSSSKAARFYPWSASYLLVTGHLSNQGFQKEISIVIILIVCLLGITASLHRFKKEEIKETIL